MCSSVFTHHVAARVPEEFFTKIAYLRPQLRTFCILTKQLWNNTVCLNIFNVYDVAYMMYVYKFMFILRK